MVIAASADADFGYFIQKIKAKSGIDLEQYKEGQMKRRLHSLREKKGYRSFTDFYQGMLKNSALYDEFLDHMTINVTEFFRNPARWNVLEKRILPELIPKHGRLKCWSAACSTGEEPYSLVMALSSFTSLRDIQVLATDIDQNVLEKAKIGRYPQNSIRDVPKSHLNTYFRWNGSDYELSEQVKRCVRFQRHNLLADPFGQDYHLIICRNVMIYFTDEAKDALYAKFSRSLKSGGYLFIGGTEQIFQPQKYQLEMVDTFFYRKI